MDPKLYLAIAMPKPYIHTPGVQQLCLKVSYCLQKCTMQQHTLNSAAVLILNLPYLILYTNRL